jgi:hypothetical protein
MTHTPHATPEQAETLQSLLEAWETLLHDLEQDPDLPQKALVSSRTILGNYKRRLHLDLQAGLEHLPAVELSKAITVAKASLQQLAGLKGNTEAT